MLSRDENIDQSWENIVSKHDQLNPVNEKLFYDTVFSLTVPFSVIEPPL